MNDLLSKVEFRRKRKLFKVLAVAVVLLPFMMLELGLVLFGVGQAVESVDPFIGFSSVRPLFQRDDENGRYTISSTRSEFFAYDEFPVIKEPNTLRIFCLGGSTVQGRPYSIETSFPTWLKLGLNVAAPSINWEIINCGGVSYASYRLIPIMQECLNYEPDLFVICTGHNEFLEDRSYAQNKRRPAWLRTSVNQLSRLRMVNVAASLLVDQRHEKSILATDADAILNYQNGLAAYHRDQAWSDSIADHFGFNMNRMIKIANHANVPILLLLPPSNLSGSPPFKSESNKLDMQDELRVEQLRAQAQSLYKSDLSRAAERWQEVCKIDSESANHFYPLGRCLEILNRHDEARTAFVTARDLDVCPLRMTSTLESLLVQVANSSKTPLINLHQLLEEQTESQILGDRWLVDHVHPNFEGQQQIAFAVGRWLEQENYVKLPTAWEAACREPFQMHFESLDRAYFYKGQRALEGLRRWTQGNADGPPAEERFPHRLPLSIESRG